jgi:amino acid transporter
MARQVQEDQTVESKRAVPAPEHESSSSDDEADKALAALGYAPVFKREFSMWSCFSFALSISGLFGTVMTTFSYPLYAGGAASAVWCWLIAGAGALCLALSIAEVSSAYPTSGGMYFTLKYLAPPQYTPVIAWFVGWLNLIGQICGSASSAYGASQMLLAAVSIGSDFTYFPTQGHIIGVMAALSAIHGGLNTLSTAWLHRFASFYAVFHIGVLLAAWVALLVLQKDKHTAAYTFTNVEPQSGWEPAGFSFLFGFLSVSWTMVCFDPPFGLPKIRGSMRQCATSPGKLTAPHRPTTTQQPTSPKKSRTRPAWCPNPSPSP